ncbi:hypothetical protein MIT9_P0882 [Methylomarinovum caldicuralii]|uniref:Uncharacterized protein n=1 Tax=Methylomarinovum caldicuralii TaxID=438856 RepID=A0AAU9C9Y6_9GAMM|nr:hypothetical protein [Methylomarinovum caldicuralii]BCX81304.1 hypothetical protein MIT9_P0882 [Methylomarinovum caldicuralii]
MSQSPAKSDQAPDFTALMTVTQHLMTCYTLRPCPVLARKVAYHLGVILSPPYREALGDWRGAIGKLREQWQRLATLDHERLRRQAAKVPVGDIHWNSNDYHKLL